MNSELCCKLTNAKFRFQVSTVDTESGKMDVKESKYHFAVVIYYKVEADIEKIHLFITEVALEISEFLHHKLVVPSENPFLVVSRTENQVLIGDIEGRSHLSFDSSCIVLVKLDNTNIGSFCSYVGTQIINKIKEKSNFEGLILKIKVKVSQNAEQRIAAMKFLID